MRTLPLLLVLAAVVLVPSSAQAEIYTRTVQIADQNQYAVEYRTLNEQAKCYNLSVNVFKEQTACTEYLAKIQANKENVLIDKCGQITKTSYTYTLPGPACSGSISTYGLKLSSSGTATTQTTSGTATYTRTLSSSAINKYSLEGGGWQKQSDGKECYLVGAQLYDTEAACKAKVAGYTEQIKALRSSKIIASCTKITKTTYSYTLPTPVCSSTLSALGLSESLGGGGKGGDENLGDGGKGPATSGGAQGGGGGTLQNPLKFDSLPELLNAILDAVVQLGAILLVFMLVWVGFLFVTAQGNPEKVSTARSALMWTVIGGLILLGAKAISEVIAATVQTL